MFFWLLLINETFLSSGTTRKYTSEKNLQYVALWPSNSLRETRLLFLKLILEINERENEMDSNPILCQYYVRHYEYILRNSSNNPQIDILSLHKGKLRGTSHK